MRAVLLVSVLLLAGCGRKETVAENETAAPTASATEEIRTFAGEGRDRLCVGEFANGAFSARAGLISYAADGKANCSIRGEVRREDYERRFTFVPTGDQNCEFDLVEVENGYKLGPPQPACAYYCGPGASLEGKTFVRMDKAEPVTDLAGDPLC